VVEVGLHREEESHVLVALPDQCEVALCEAKGERERARVHVPR